jgi:MFS transporter, Spinster family, sphingosine-1-phosphate transporter
LFPVATRGRVMAVFCAAIPVGSALGYVLGGLISQHLGWRWAFYLVTPPGLILGALAFWQRDPRVRDLAGTSRRRATMADYTRLFRTRSYVLNIIAQTAMTFVLGGIAFWIPAYLQYRHQPASGTVIFGGITVVAGLISTLAGGALADRLRPRYPGSYFAVSGLAMLLAFPLFLLMLFTPFPAAWIFLFASVFFVFFNTGPSNTALANVSLPSVRATAFALNILIIHLLGDAAAPPLIGIIAGHFSMKVAFVFVSLVMLVAAAAWLVGVKYLAADTATVEAAGDGA